MLYFAYGANINRSQMNDRCPCAELVGRAFLGGHRFLVNRCGWATVVPDAESVTHGILWDLSAECLQTLDRQERVDEGLYSKRSLPVTHAGEQVLAMAYIAADDVPGLPNPGYLERIVAWAGKWSMPPGYVEELVSWSGAARMGQAHGPGTRVLAEHTSAAA
jgi:hypothetical protein